MRSFYKYLDNKQHLLLNRRKFQIARQTVANYRSPLKQSLLRIGSNSAISSKNQNCNVKPARARAHRSCRVNFAESFAWRSPANFRDSENYISQREPMTRH
jgi:hypothetical protein